jgi:hypothetical protein
MKKDLTGQTFGLLIVEERHSTTRNGHIRWLCRCDCGKQAAVLSTHLIQGNTTSCGCQRFKRGKDHKQWTGYGGISGQFWSSIAAASRPGRRRPFPVEITVQEAWDLFERQDGRCALTGLPLVMPRRFKEYDGGTAALDRRDNTRGYTLDNVQWIHKDVNMMKNKFDQGYFISMCRRVAEHSAVVCEIEP